MQKYSFRKFKHTSQLFFTRSNTPATVTIYEDRFEIKTHNINYMGQYYIKSVENQKMGTTVYHVCRIIGNQSEEEIKQSLEWGLEPFLIQVTKFKNVISLYDSSNSGIILKR